MSLCPSPIRLKRGIRQRERDRKEALGSNCEGE